MRGSQPHRGLPDSPAAPQVAHPLVQKQLVDYVHNGFLVPVMGPALHKVRDPWQQVWDGSLARAGGQGPMLPIHVTPGSTCLSCRPRWRR